VASDAITAARSALVRRLRDVWHGASLDDVIASRRLVRKLPYALGFLAVILLSGSLSAFTTKWGGLATGHEELIRLAAVNAGGVLAEPVVPAAYGLLPTDQITEATALCSSSCDHFRTWNWRTWSAIMGSRWTDIGGYSTSLGEAACVKAAFQDNDDVQYVHSLRRRCDVGGDGLRRAHAGTVAVVRDRFMLATAAQEGSMKILDGGAAPSYFIVDVPYFLLGLAIHTLQDSFSTEHTARSSDWRKLRNFNTYVDTLRVPRHSVALEAPGDVIVNVSGPIVTPTDVARIYRWDNLKPSAQAAVLASADLMKAFAVARQPGADKEAIWETFANTWLALEPDPNALATDSDPICATRHDAENIERKRELCIGNAPPYLVPEPILMSGQVKIRYPKFLRAKSSGW
jgi:hypothetical protein